MQVSISIFENITHTRDGKEIPIDLFLHDVKEGKWQDQVLGYNTGKVDKKSLPYVTISGRFGERKISGLIAHSGFICMDIDDVDVNSTKAQLAEDRYTYAAFVSVSGKGLAVMFKINPDKHGESFDGLSQYLFETYNIVCDPSCRDVSRPRFVSYDPHLYLNERADKFAKYPAKKSIKKVPDVVYVQSDFDGIVKEICARRLDLAPNYQQWLQIGFAISDKFGEDGRSYFHQVSQWSEKYNTSTCDRQYTNCLKAQKSGVTIATFYWYAKNAGVTIISDQTRLISQTAYLAKKGRRTADDTVKLLKAAEGISEQDSQAIVSQVFQNNIKVDSENPVEALETWLRQNYDIRRNVVTRRIEIAGNPAEVTELNTIYIAAKKAFDKINYELVDRVIHSSFTPDYNPLHEFFEKNRHRQPKGIIKSLMETITTDTGLDEGNFFPQYAVHFGMKWFVGIVSAVFGNHCPLMLVLSGSTQNIGKTEWFRRVLPKELRSHYYAESKLDSGKDDELLMTQKLLIMDDEMGGKSKAEAKRLKELTSKQTFSLREPYGRYNVDLNRLAVLCGTTNDSEILNDPTGNRRIIPINVLDINQDVYNEIDKVDVLMEAYHLYKDGFKWQLSRNDIRLLNENTGDFEQTSPEYDLFLKYFEIPESQKPGGNNFFMTATEVKAKIEDRSRQKINPTRLGIEMKKMGLVRQPIKKSGFTQRGYYLIEKSHGVAG